MKCIIPEISWHNRDPVLSVDIQPRAAGSSDVHRLASGGTDSHVLIWHMTETETGTVHIEIAADLTRHQRAVNVVRWSPSGEYLASGDDESVIFVWKMKSANETRDIFDGANDLLDKETWLTMKILRGHMEDVYDLAWSPDSLQLISGSVDNTAIVWDVMKGRSLAILSEHKSFVQGVAWDPQNQYLATLSTDRSMRLFDVATRKVLTRCSKSALPVAEDSPLYGKIVRVFHDDTLQTFYRRLCFSPDGELLFAPAGVADLNVEAKPIHTTYIYTRHNTKQPAIVLPSPDQFSIAVRCCPLLFELRDHDVENNPPVIGLPYRMVFAVATKSSVYLYDTQQHMPIGLISNIHYTRLTDLAWSSDGRILIVSSTDGFCTMITFAIGELGTVYKAVVIGEIEEPSIADTDDLLNQSICISSDDDDDDDDDEVVEIIEDDAKPLENVAKVIANRKDFSNMVPNPIAIRRKPRVCEDEPQKTGLAEMVASETIVENVTIQKEVNPIALRLKPKSPELEMKEVTIQKPTEVKPTPIEFRRKPRSPKLTTLANTTNAAASEPHEVDISQKVLGLDMPAVIISTKDKFESSEILNRPATPIQTRREPRDTTPTSIVTAMKTSTTELSHFKLGQFAVQINDTDEQTPPKSDTTAATPLSTTSTKKTKKTPATGKKATPIAVRRHQRNILPTVSAVDRSAIEDEALDAWPIDQPRPITTVRHTTVVPPPPPVAAVVPLTPATTTTAVTDVDNTEDIRLVYEDESQRETDNKTTAAVPIIELKSPMKENVETNVCTPESKTPRRVELRTISTPKSKKKLL